MAEEIKLEDDREPEEDQKPEEDREPAEVKTNIHVKVMYWTLLIWLVISTVFIYTPGMLWSLIEKGNTRRMRTLVLADNRATGQIVKAIQDGKLKSFSGMKHVFKFFLELCSALISGSLLYIGSVGIYSKREWFPEQMFCQYRVGGLKHDSYKLSLDINLIYSLTSNIPFYLACVIITSWLASTSLFCIFSYLQRAYQFFSMKKSVKISVKDFLLLLAVQEGDPRRKAVQQLPRSYSV